MSEPSRSNEPSMEEILASIRKIIADDEGEEEKVADRGATPPQPLKPRSAAEEGGAASDAESDEEILDLTQMVGDDGTVVDLATQEAQKKSADPDIELAEDNDPAASLFPEKQEGDEREPLRSAVEAAKPSTPEQGQSGHSDTLVSSATAAAATAALSEIASAIERKEEGVASTPLTGGKTLEDLVREALTPHVKVWLDENLAPLVERIVREEIQKMVHRAETR